MPKSQNLPKHWFCQLFGYSSNCSHCDPIGKTKRLTSSNLEVLPILVSVITAITVSTNAFTLTQQCSCNLACSLSLEIAQNLSDVHYDSCWVCHHLGTHHWSSFPLDNGTAAEANKSPSSCMILVDTVWLLRMSAYYHSILKGYNGTMGSGTVDIMNAIHKCGNDSSTENNGFNECRSLPGGKCSPNPIVILKTIQVFNVPEKVGDTCICAHSKESSLMLGYSLCKVYVNVTLSTE